MNINPNLNTQEPAPIFHNNTPADSCQEKTLVPLDTIPEKCVFNVYPNCIEYLPASPKNHTFEGHRGHRGSIKEFSKRSRFRLFKLLAKINDKIKQKPIFVSLTYHYGHLNNPKSTKSQLHIFLTRLRQFDPGVQFIWRIEFQIRGAPHYHLIIFPGNPIRRSHKGNYTITLSKIWHSIADPKSNKHKEYGCNIKTIHSYLEACIYLSKYVAKCSETKHDLLDGKHWGSSKNLPFKVVKSIKLSSFQSAYLIEKIRLWLLKIGKFEQADKMYLNWYSETTVFMNLADFKEIDEQVLPSYIKLPHVPDWN